MNKSALLFFYVLLCLIGLNGCVQQPIDEGLVKPDDSERALQSAKIHTELAAEYFRMGQLEVAIEEIQEALKAQSGYAMAHNVRGLIHMSLNENKKAMESFEQAIRLAPKNPDINNNYGWFLCQRIPQRMDQAMIYFTVAISDPLYSTREMSYTNAGVCELKRQGYKEAYLYFQKALAIQPNYMPAMIGLIDADFRRGNLKDAKSKLAVFLQNNNPTPESLLMAIQIEQAMGNPLAVDSYVFQLQKHFPESKEAIAIREGNIK